MSIAIIAYNTGQTDGTGNPPTVDALRFVCLQPLAAGTVIYFTDRAWNGTAFTAGGGDGVATYTVPAGGLAAGATINLTGAALGTLNPEEAGDTIYAYQGSNADTPADFLFAIELGDGNSSFNGSLVNTGLTAGVDAIGVGLDSGSYQGPTTEAGAYFFNGESLLQNIADAANWSGDDRDGQNALDHPDHSGPYGVAGDISLWTGAAGGGGGIVGVSGDASVDGGNSGYNLDQIYNNLLDAGVNVFYGIRDVVFDTADGKVFIADSDLAGHNRILQADISDLLGNPSSIPSLTVLYSDATSGTASYISNLQLDTANNIVYFTHGQTFAKVGYDTAGQAQTVLATLGGTGSGNPNGTSNSGFVDDFVINFATGDVYLTAHRVLAAQDGDVVSRNFLYRIAGLDPSDGAGAFSWGNGAVTTMNFSPDDDDVVNPTDIFGEAFPQELGTLEGVALSADGNTLYFTTASILWDHDGDGGYAGDGDPGTTDPLLQMGGVYSYALTGNPAGAYTVIWQQIDDGDTNSQATSPAFGPQGLLDDIEVDPVTGKLYFLDFTGDQLGATNPPGDEGIWSINPNGTGLGFFQPIFNINGLGASSLFLNHAPTAGGSALAATATEASSGPGSGLTTGAALFSGVTLSDADTPGGDELAGAVIRISAGYETGAGYQDYLMIAGGTSGTITGIQYNFDLATGVMTLTGPATVAEYKAAIELVRFVTSGDNVTNYGAAPTRTVSWSVTDGLDFSDELSATVTVVGINDAPVNTVGGTHAATEDTASAINGLNIHDPDADPTSQDITVTLAVGHGTLTLLDNVPGGLTAGDMTGNGTATVTITATQNQINTTLGFAIGITYAPSAHFNGADALTVTTNDNGLNGNDPGLTGTGTSEQDQDSKAITVQAVNDAPTVTGDGSEDSAAIYEDQPSATGQTVYALFSGQYSDQLDNQYNPTTNPTGSSPGSFGGIAVIGNAAGAATGNWEYFEGGVWKTIPTDASLAGATLIGAGAAIRFNPAADYNGAEPLLTVRLVDNSLGFGIDDGQIVDISGPGATGGTSAYSTASVTLGGTVLAVNDAPTAANLDGDAATWVEGGSAVFLDAGSNAAIDDVDSDNFDGGMLTVSIASPLAQDGLFIDTSGTVTTPGAGVLAVGGVQIATYSGGGYGGGDLVFTFDADATPDAVQALIRAITYDNNGGESPTEGTRTIGWTLIDGDGDANGGEDTLTLSSTVDVQQVNDAPAGADATFTILEDESYVFSAGSFGFSDVNGDDFAGVLVTSIPAVGTLFHDADGAGGAAAVAVTAGAFIAASEIVLGHLAFVPAQDANGAPYASFTFQVRDDAGIANGGQDTDQSPNMITFNVTAVNDAPTLTTSGGAAAFAEGVNVASTPVVVDSGVTLSDPDSATLESATVQITGNLASDQDLLAFTNTNAATYGDIGASYTQATGTLTLTSASGTATVAQFQAALRAVTYTNSSQEPGEGNRTLSFSVDDGSATSLVATKTVTVSAYNDSPSGADATITIAEDAARTLSVGDFAFSDVDGDAFARVRFTSAPVGGKLFFDADGPGGAGAPVEITTYPSNNFTVADLAAGRLTFVPTADLSGTGAASIQFVVGDDGGSVGPGQAFDQSPNTLTFNITPVDDAPVNTVPGGQTINEDGSLTLSTANGNAIAVADVDTGMLTVTLSVGNGSLTLAGTTGLSFTAGDGTGDATMTFSGTASAINAALDGLSYSPAANYHGSDVINVTTGDGSAIDIDTVGIAINSVNDAPSGTDGTIEVSENDNYYFTIADFGFTDIDGNGFIGIVFTSLPSAGTLYLDGMPIAAAIGISFPNPAAFAAMMADERFWYEPPADQSGNDFASFTFQVMDNGGAANGGQFLDGSPNTITIDIAPDNIPPVVDLNGAGGGIDYSTTFVEDGTAVAIGAGITITDEDGVPGAAIESALVTLTDRVAGDSLAFSTPLPPGFSANVTGAANTLTIEISGTGTAAEYQAILESLVYSTTNQDPTVGGTDPSRTITVTVNDGISDSAAATTTVNITAVDDLPVAQPDAFTINENGTITGASLFADNGSGPDTDPDGPPLSIAAVNGSAANVGTTITLASGALLTVNANGTFDYDPGTVFLPTPTADSGASNTPAQDSFTYTLAGAGTVTVTITLTGLDTDDLLLGTAGVDVLIAGVGDDTLIGGASGDVLNGGVDSDTASYRTAATGVTVSLTNPGINTGDAAGDSFISIENLEGSAFADTLMGDAGANDFIGGDGRDLVSYRYATSAVWVLLSTPAFNIGDALGDTYTSIENLEGSAFNDMLGGDAGANDFFGGDGIDLVTYAFASAGVVASLGNGTIGFGSGTTQTGEAAGDRYNSIEMLQGSSFNDVLFAAAGGSMLVGLGGADTLYGLGGNDTLFGDAGQDMLIGDDGADELWGGGDSDTLRGDAGADHLYGEDGNDSLDGGAGIDVLDGGAGNDNYTGGGGADIFVIADLGGTDTITDFKRAQGDKIDLGSLAIDEWIGTQAFHNDAGEVRIRNAGSQWWLEGDTNGDGVADFSVAMGSVKLVETDLLIA